MAWLELTVQAVPEAVDWVWTLLAEVEEVSDLQVIDLADAESPPADPSADVAWQFCLRWYIPDTGNVNLRVSDLTQRLSPMQRTGLISEAEIYRVDEKLVDLRAPTWHRIGQRFVVISGGQSPSDLPPETIPLFLEPSFAFGSGFHPATILALRLLERHVRPGMQTLDLGSGSGILSVAMAKLGAQVLALDNDPQAIRATQAAVERNQVTPQVTAAIGSLGQGSELGHWMGGQLSDPVPAVQYVQCFNLIAANILARVHIALAADYSAALVPNGLLITAGYTTEYADEIDAAFTSAGLELIETEVSQEWSTAAYRRKPDYSRAAPT
jgi:ribosomal protein L11 methyltransferase